MEVYFNELCLNQTTMIQYADISRIGTLYKRLRSRNILGCRISHNDYAEVIRQAGTMPGTNPNVISFLFAFLRQPYEDEGVEERQEDYLSSSWSYEGKACYGLALAYIMESMSVSICDQAWNQPILQVQRDSATEDVRNLYDEETFLYHLEWLEGLQPIELIICQNSPEEKRIKLNICYGCMNRVPEGKEVCPECGYVLSRRSNPHDALPEGTVLSRKYLVGKVLGRGGFGITYLGYDLDLQKTTLSCHPLQGKRMHFPEDVPPSWKRRELLLPMKAHISFM